MKKIFFFAIILVSAILTACAAQPASTPTQTPKNTPTQLVKNTHTPTQPVQNTPIASETSINGIARAIPLPTGTITPTPKATEQIDASILAMFAPCTIDGTYSYSPGKKWVFANCFGENQDGLTTKFVSTDGSKQWSISFNDLYIKPYKTTDDPSVSTLLQESFIPTHWTALEDYVYLAIPSSAIPTSTDENPDPYISPYELYDGLFRLNLTSGKVTQTLKPAAAPYTTSYAFKFSAGTKLAYINESVHPMKIVINDTVTGDEKIIDLGPRYSDAGALLWPVDDEKRLFLSTFDPDSSYGGYSFIMYDLETNKQVLYSAISPYTWIPVRWIDAETIYIHVDTTDTWYYLNTRTAKFSEAPAP